MSDHHIYQDNPGNPGLSLTSSEINAKGTRQCPATNTMRTDVHIGALGQEHKAVIISNPSDVVHIGSWNMWQKYKEQ